MRTVKTLLISFITIVFTLCAVGFAHAKPYWWERGDEGWFFYNERQNTQPKPEEQPIDNTSKNDTMLYSERMKRLGEELLSNAIENPTVENVRNFMLHNLKMLNKAQQVSKVWQKVLTQEPYLRYVAREHPVEEMIDAFIRSLNKDMGLYFIYSSTCQYCSMQANELLSFSKQYNFAVFPISLDGGILPQYPNSVVDNGISKALGVSRTPAIFLVNPYTKHFIPVAHGYISSYELRFAIYYAVADFSND